MHIMSIALGGCLRAEPVRYGITEDTGGHITYILGEMEALSLQKDVELAEIVTRRFDAPELGAIHLRPEEWVNDKCVIRRIDSGNLSYLAKEELAEDRIQFISTLREELRSRDRLPDVIHAHFADAADVASHIEREFGIPFIYTAHSLGLDKLEAAPDLLDELGSRIEEEDRAICAASAIIGSSRDECERQLLAYPSTQIGSVHRVVPGVVEPHVDKRARRAAIERIRPFLRDPRKPIILAVARPVAKKNLMRLVEAFGAGNLRDKANLVILAGLRDGLKSHECEKREVLTDVLDAIDRHNLYGHTAYPPQHTRSEVSALYALAQESGGVFVNPAKVEPYGLTLVEAASHGLPVVATQVGGPIDIVDQLDHGILVDPNQTGEIADAIARLLDDRELWEAKSSSALANIGTMTWSSYAEQFVSIARDMAEKREECSDIATSLLISDLDNTLTGCPDGAARLRAYLERHPDMGFVLATGRSIVEARRIVREWKLPNPRAWITSVGTEIYLPRDCRVVRDRAYSRAIATGWDAEAVTEALRGISGLRPQPNYEQRQFKRSYFAEGTAVAEAVRAQLLECGLYARTVLSHSNLLDVIPIAAGKARAMKHVAEQMGVSLAKVFAAGDSGNDEDLLTVCSNSILVANHSSELVGLRERQNVYVSRRPHAQGTLEGLLAHQMRQREINRTGQAA